MATTQKQFNEIKIANPSLEGNNRTYLTSDSAAAATSLSVISTSGHQFLITGDQDYYILVEDYGREKAEIKLVDASDAGTSATAFKVAALTHSHEASDPITFIPYNQIIIYGLTESGGSKTLLATIDIDPTEQYTKYVYEGSTYTHFVFAYYNSNDDEMGEYSEEIAISTDFSRTSVKQVIDSALKKAMTKVDESAEGKLSWDIAIETVNDGLDEIMARKRKWEFLHKVDGTSTDTVAKTAYISKPSDLAVLEHIIIDNKKLEWMSRLQYDIYTKAGVTVSTGNPTHYTLKNNKYYLYPTPSSAWDVIYEYFKYPTEITNLGDSVDKPFVSILKYYCAAQFCWIRGNEKRGDKMFSLYQQSLERAVEEFTGPEQLGDAESIEYTRWNNLDGGDYLF